MPYSINSPCPVCGREFNYSIVKMDNDIRHEIGCPYCNATVGWASGTDEVNTCRLQNHQNHLQVITISNQNAQQLLHYWALKTYFVFVIETSKPVKL